MSYKLHKWKSSNYQIDTKISAKEFETIKQNVLKEAQKDFTFQWFRKGHVPMNIVEANVNQQFLTVNIYENIVNKTLQKVVDEHKDLQLIGQIYDLNVEKDWNDQNFSFKIDVYPEIKAKNKNWEAIKATKEDETINEKELEDIINMERKRFANYEPSEKIDEDSIFRVEFVYKLDWKQIDRKFRLVYSDDLANDEEIKKFFLGKKKWDLIETKNEKLPKIFQTNEKTDEVNADILEVMKMIIPEFNDENVEKFFQGQYKTLEEYKTELKKYMAEAKSRQVLTQAIDKYLTQALESYDFELPQTIINQEKQRRIEEFKKSVGWEEGFKNYSTHYGAERMKEIDEEMNQLSVDSLKKTFVLFDILKNLDIQVKEWDDIESMLFEKVWETKKSSKKEDKEEKKTK